jgi:AraC family transcriptional regulator of adaptative response/methylated-DNA-[protein]-cysteine methyltransferase
VSARTPARKQRSAATRAPRHRGASIIEDPAMHAATRSTTKAAPDLVALAEYIRAHADESLPLSALAARVGLSPSRLQRRFVDAFGVSPRAYQDAERHARYKAALRAGRRVTDAIVDAGYGSTSRVYGEATRQLGMTPRAYRAGGAGETIYHALRQTALGPLLMAATARGVCFAQFGDDQAALLAQLAAEFPAARLQPSDAAEAPALDAWIAALDAHLTDHAPRPDLPLDLRGTAFQVRVWQFLLGIPNGSAISYTELAAGIGSPRAVRAAASACAANRIAVLVPCHRVLRGDGGLGGYRWGLERKRALLDAERAMGAGRPAGR